MWPTKRRKEGLGSSGDNPYALNQLTRFCLVRFFYHNPQDTNPIILYRKIAFESARECASEVARIFKYKHEFHSVLAELSL